jgi:MFS family permease
MNNLPLKKIYQAWFAIAIFYLFQYVLRAFPNIMFAEMRPSLAMTASEYGFLGALNLYTYAALQIPLGILLDKYGVRKIVLCGISICLLGVTLMLNRQNQDLAYLSRFLIGAGSSCAFMSAIKLIADYMPEGKKGLLIGCTLTIGTVGAAISSNLIMIFFARYNWQATILLILIIGIAIFFNTIKNLPETESNISTNNKIELKPFLAIISNKNIIYYAIASIALYAPFSVIADIWGGNFFQQKFNLSNNSSSMTSMLMYIGLGIGSIIIPTFVEKRKISDQIILISMILIGGLLAVLIYAPINNLKLLYALSIVIGFLCATEMVCFTGLANYVNKNNSGFAIGVVNSFNIFFAGAGQHLVGYLLDYNWTGEIGDKQIRVYSLDNFKFAFSSLIILLGLCLVFAVIRYIKKPQN